MLGETSRAQKDKDVMVSLLTGIQVIDLIEADLGQRLWTVGWRRGGKRLISHGGARSCGYLCTVR